MQPPNIALPCGHVVCPEDFEQIGGKITERNHVSATESDDDDDGVEDEVEFRREFFEHLQDSGVLSPDATSMVEGMLMGDAFGDSATRSTNPFLPSPFDYDDGDDDVEDDVSFPRLLSDVESGEDDSTSSMPGLVQGGGGGGESSSDDEDMPTLLPRGRGGSDSSSSDDDSMPGLNTRGAQVHIEDSSSDDGSMPGLAARRRNNDSDDDSSNGPIPPLLPAQQPANWDDDDSNNSMPGLTDRPAAGIESDFSDDDDDIDGNFAAGVFLIKSDLGMLRCDTTRKLAVVRASQLPSGATFFPMMDGYMVMEGNKVTGYDFRGNYFVERFMFSGISNFANAQIVSDSVHGMWTLTADPNIADCKLLRYFDRDEFPNGKLVRRVSSRSTLIQGAGKIVWVHVQHTSSHINAGLWYFKVGKQKQVRKTGEISSAAKIVPDGNRGLVWVMESGAGNDSSTTLSLIGRNADDRETTAQVNCDFTRETKLIANNNGGVYVHTRKNGAWGLYLYDGILTHQKRCPKDARVVADILGNAWILQKENRNSSHRVLYKVMGQAGTSLQSSQRFPGGMTIIGAF